MNQETIAKIARVFGNSVNGNEGLALAANFLS